MKFGPLSFTIWKCHKIFEKLLIRDIKRSFLHQTMAPVIQFFEGLGMTWAWSHWSHCASWNDFNDLNLYWQNRFATKEFAKGLGHWAATAWLFLFDIFSFTPKKNEFKIHVANKTKSFFVQVTHPTQSPPPLQNFILVHIFHYYNSIRIIITITKMILSRKMPLSWKTSSLLYLDN